MASSKVMATTSPANQDQTRHQSFISSDHNNNSNNLVSSMNMDDLLKNIYDQSPSSFPASDGTGDPEMTLEDYLTKTGGVREEDAGVKLAPEYSGVIDPIMCAGDGAITAVPFQGVPRQQQHMQVATGGQGVRGKRKIVVDDRPVDKATQQKQRRMIKNLESAARSRERKQAYTVELESLVTQLEEEHARLLKEADELNKERLQQEVGLSICQAQQRIPYQIIPALKPMRAQIEQVLEIVCESNNIPLAQVWIPFENDSQTKDKFAIKLTGYCVKKGYSNSFKCHQKSYCDTSDMFPLKMGEHIVGKTLQDYKPRFCKLIDDFSTSCSRLAICLRSTNTDEFDYVFDFIWLYKDNYIILLKALLLALKKYLPSFKVASGAELDDEFHVIDFENSTTSEIKFEEILAENIQSPISANMKYPQQQLSQEKRMVDNYVAPSETMCSTTPWHKRNGAELVDNYMAPSEATCTTTTLTLLPREVTERQFGDTIEQATKKRNGPGDELDVPDVENSTRADKVLQENIRLPVPEALERGKKSMVEYCIALSARKYKTAPILLSKENIEHQYGKTMKEAANALKVCISTLKRKCKDFGISEWQGPNAAKRKVKDPINQSYTNEGYDGAVQDPSAINKNENTLTIKAEYLDDMIRFDLGISEATFITVEEEIGKKFKLTHGTYKLKYLDEDKDWILLASDQDMSVCMKSSRNLGRIVVRLRVLPSTQPISG